MQCLGHAGMQLLIQSVLHKTLLRFQGTFFLIGRLYKALLLSQKALQNKDEEETKIDSPYQLKMDGHMKTVCLFLALCC